MDETIVARVLHVLGVVVWIGGVALVTTVLLPATKRMKTPSERIEFFESIERGFRTAGACYHACHRGERTVSRV